VRPILSLRSRLRALLRRSALPKQPIVFDFIRGRIYRESERHPLEEIQDVAKRITKKRVVKTVEGLPPQVVTHPKK